MHDPECVSTSSIGPSPAELEVIARQEQERLDQANEDDDSDLGLILGLTIGGVVLLAVAGVIGLYFYKRR